MEQNIVKTKSYGEFSNGRIGEIDIVLYHGYCPDGIGGMYSVLKKHPLGNKVPVEGIFHKTIPQIDIESKVVMIIDICPEVDILTYIVSKAKLVIILDHHNSSFKTLDTFMKLSDLGQPDKIVYILDNQRSGAQIAYDWANGNCFETTDYTIEFDFELMDNQLNSITHHFKHVFQREWIIDIIADRDLWKFEIPYSKQLSAGLYNYYFYGYDKLLMISEMNDDERNKFMSKLLLFGNEKVKAEKTEIDRYAKKFFLCKFRIGKEYGNYGPYTIGTVDAPYHLRSELLNTIAEKKNEDGIAVCDFAMIYHYDAIGDEWWISFRGADSCVIPIDEICSALSGGGHRNACGFTILGPRSKKKGPRGDFNTFFEILQN